ncbi:MAG: 4Fe-4S dicluster domain-containing protein [Candidatus Altiarchaeota archaeon]|nr:4Fe-4S dicluster domain-containing protein [Candidatus Altiarchaeota archaeon]
MVSGRVIQSKDLDPNFKHEITREPGGEQIKYCFQCATCSASCPVMRINPKYNPRRIIYMSLLGMRDEVLKSEFIWLCSSCYTCYERCPQDVKITELMNAIKNIAVKEGHINESMEKLLEIIEEHGRAYPIGEFENKKRSRLNLPPIKETPEETRKILGR